MRKPSYLVLAIPLVLSFGAARADILPPGHKGVLSLSIEVRRAGWDGTLITQTA